MSDEQYNDQMAAQDMRIARHLSATLVVVISVMFLIGLVFP